jgi:hypothetical protein
VRIFISWSGHRSQAVAEALKEWLPRLFQAVEPWISSADIRAGSRWAVEVAKALETTDFGILCVTKENLNAPWLLFEAGALSRSLSVGKVVPYLLDLEPHQLTGPLSQFQAVKADETGTGKLVRCVAEQHNENRRPGATLAHVYAAFWPELSSVLKHIEESSIKANPAAESAGVSRADISELPTEDAIAQLDPDKIGFIEYELKLSDTWPSFMQWLRKRTAPLELVSVQEDENREATFYSSGKPGHMNYPIAVSCSKAGLNTTVRFDVVTEWLHPQILDLRGSDAGIPWDTSLFPVGRGDEKESLINDPHSKLRDAQYWVLFARPR